MCVCVCVCSLGFCKFKCYNFFDINRIRFSISNGIFNCYDYNSSISPNKGGATRYRLVELLCVLKRCVRCYVLGTGKNEDLSRARSG